MTSSGAAKMPSKMDVTASAMKMKTWDDQRIVRLRIEG
jgi:hypothetical protein